MRSFAPGRPLVEADVDSSFADGGPARDTGSESRISMNAKAQSLCVPLDLFSPLVAVCARGISEFESSDCFPQDSCLFGGQRDLGCCVSVRCLIRIKLQ